MSETKTRPAAHRPGAVGPAEQVTEALAGFLQEFNGFQAEVTSALHQQEERLTMLQAKTMTYGRPILSTAVETEEPHKKAFNAYLRHGDDEALRGLALEGKALSTAVAGDGGYLVDPRTADTVKSMLVATGSIRSIASVVTVDSSNFDVLIDRSDVGTGWVTETGSVSETATPLIERISIRLHQLAAMPKASQRLLDDSAFDVEGWLAEKIASRFIRSESAAFVNGDGVDKPKGILLPAKVPDSAWTWGSLGYVASGAAADFPTTNAVDCIVNLVYALAAPYRANATFVMNSKTAGAVRKMKDADGRFMWADGLAVAEPPRLMGYPVLIAGYTIAERTDLRILRDPFSAKPHVLFYATKRVGGDISDYAAIKLLKFALT